MVNEDLKQYVEEAILPMYDNFDAAHRRDHVDMVINQSMEIARGLSASAFRPSTAPGEESSAALGEEPASDSVPAEAQSVDLDMVYAIAAYHDTGLTQGRERHHLVSGEIIRRDGRLKEWFDDREIEVMAEAVEDHRASSDHAPRSIYGRIVAEADRFIDPDTIITRAIQYGIAHYPDLDQEAHWQRVLAHLRAKYGDGGYLRLWFPASPNAARLAALRSLLRHSPSLRSRFNILYTTLTTQK